MPKYSSSNRLTEPLEPNKSFMATAPTKGGMMSGMMPSVWMMMAPEKIKTCSEIGQRQSNQGRENHRHGRYIKGIIKAFAKQRGSEKVLKIDQRQLAGISIQKRDVNDF